MPRLSRQCIPHISMQSLLKLGVCSLPSFLVSHVVAEVRVRAITDFTHSTRPLPPILFIGLILHLWKEMSLYLKRHVREVMWGFQTFLSPLTNPMSLGIVLSHPQLFALGVALVLWVFRTRGYRSNPKKLPLPPGPKGYPFIGNLLNFPTYKPWLVYAEWCKKFNSDIIYFEVLGQPFIVLNTLKRTNDIFEKRSSNYSDRVRMPMVMELMNWTFNVGLLPYGDWWRVHRRTFHEHFRQNAVGRYQPIQQREALAMLRRLLDTPDNFLHHVRHTFAATIMRVVYGIDVRESDDPYILNVEEVLNGFAEAAIPGRFLVDLIPALKYVPEWFPGAEFKRKAMRWRRVTGDVVVKPFEHVKKNLKAGTATPCLSTTLIENLPVEGDPAKEEEETIAMDTAAVAYIGGADTTLSVVKAFFLAMAMYPSAQKKAQAQIDAVVGSNRLPDYNDRPALPYINAMVKEAMRWQIVVPLGIPHMATNEDEYDGYFIPKGSIIMGSTWTLLRDPEIFDQPEDYIPERYLQPDGQLNPNVRDPGIAAFGYGRRICPGRYMSDNSLYIIIVTLLAAYDIKPPLDEGGNEVKLSHEVTSGILSYPVPFKCRITPRSPAAEALIKMSQQSD
ncbi:cytochrome P450 [Cyathus striatus]|nr:cytochrome P450 [Cyathus striatus]